jgi:hypothetical protein
VITRIEAHNYHCFQKLAIDLDRYHVRADAPGAGKTTPPDVPVLLGDVLRDQSVVAIFPERPTPGRAPRATTWTGPLHKGPGDAVAVASGAESGPSVLEVLGDNIFRDLNRPEPMHLRCELRLEITPRNMRAAVISVRQCQDAAFNHLGDHLRSWFPEQP